jgi:beta-phosphoglucomutase-like phosphatase (HAD superfamily)
VVLGGTLCGVHAKRHTRPTRTFWWDRKVTNTADDLRAVIFDADSALADIDCDDARTGLIDSVMSLFVAGIWVGVVSARPRAQVQTLVRQLLGDGLVETIVTIDDLPEPDAGLARGGELYRLALWEMGITPRNALAVTGPGVCVSTPAAAGLPAVVVDAVRVPGDHVAEVRRGYDGPDPLSATSCQRAHRRWWIRQAA